jgi:hypothetical protein
VSEREVEFFYAARTGHHRLIAATIALLAISLVPNRATRLEELRSHLQVLEQEFGRVVKYRNGRPSLEYLNGVVMAKVLVSKLDEEDTAGLREVHEAEPLGVSSLRIDAFFPGKGPPPEFVRGLVSRKLQALVDPDTDTSIVRMRAVPVFVPEVQVLARYLAGLTIEERKSTDISVSEAGPDSFLMRCVRTFPTVINVPEALVELRKRDLGEPFATVFGDRFLAAQYGDPSLSETRYWFAGQARETTYVVCPAIRDSLLAGQMFPFDRVSAFTNEWLQVRERPIAGALSLVATEIDREEPNPVFEGVRVARAHMFYWGPLVLLRLQFVALLAMNQIETVSERGIAKPAIAWTLLCDGWLAGVLAMLTLLCLPLVAAATSISGPPSLARYVIGGALMGMIAACGVLLMRTRVRVLNPADPLLAGVIERAQRVRASVNAEFSHERREIWMEE